MKWITFFRSPLAVLLVSLLFARCQTKQDTPGEAKPEVSIPPPRVELAITKIDDMPVEPGKKPEVGLQVMVNGTISDSKALLCVLVHPMTADMWWVQSLPSPPGRVSDTTWSWRTLALCGTPKLGRKDEYEIVAVAESERDICVAGKVLKAQQFPSMLPRSEIITVKRVRN